MSRCKTVELFYALVPLKPWRGFLIRSHIENCPHCQADLALREAVESLLVRETAVDIGRPLWAEVESVLVEDSAAERMKDRAVQLPVMRRWGWAVATAFLIVLVTSFWLLKDFRPEGASPTAAVSARFELEYVRVGGQPASAVVYQPQGSDIIIIWAGKNP
jgi:anti-sigma factor RsiW